MNHDLTAVLDWLQGVIITLKPAVSAFFSDLGAMIANRPAPASEVCASMAVLVVLVLLVPRIVKKLSK